MGHEAMFRHTDFARISGFIEDLRERRVGLPLALPGSHPVVPAMPDKRKDAAHSNNHTARSQLKKQEFRESTARVSVQHRPGGAMPG